MLESVEVVSDALADSFLGVGVLVAVMLVAMGVARRRWGESWDRWFVSYPKAGPAVAAALSLPPGCSGVITTVTLFGERRVTFGSVVAAMLATMGDSAWILIAANPTLAVTLKITFLVGGAIGGYLVDALHIEPRARQLTVTASQGAQHLATVTTLRGSGDRAQHGETGSRSISKGDSSTDLKLPIMRSADINVDWWEAIEPCCVVSAETSPSSQKTPSQFGFLDALFWFAVAIGLIFAIPVEFLGVDEDAFAAIIGPHGFVLAGVFGFACAVATVLRGRGRDRDCHCVEHSNFLAALGHTTYRAAAMIVLVGLVSMSIVLVVDLTGLDVVTLPFYGLLGVLLAAIVGILPSCGLEVIIAGLFVAGGMPFAALLAYLISHNGAGLLPLLAIHRRSALVSVVITTSAAVILGCGALLIS